MRESSRRCSRRRKGNEKGRAPPAPEIPRSGRSPTSGTSARPCSVGSPIRPEPWPLASRKPRRRPLRSTSKSILRSLRGTRLPAGAPENVRALAPSTRRPRPGHRLGRRVLRALARGAEIVEPARIGSNRFGYPEIVYRGSLRVSHCRRITPGEEGGKRFCR